MREIFEQIATDEIKKELGIYNETLAKKLESASVGQLLQAFKNNNHALEEIVGDVLGDTYDSFISQYDSLAKKVETHVNKKLEVLAKHVNDVLTELKRELKSGRYDNNEEERESVKNLISYLEDNNSIEELQHYVHHMLEQENRKDMSFVDYILTDGRGIY